MTETARPQEQQRQITPNDKVHILTLHGGIGARIIQTGFIRSLQKADPDLPVVIVDNTPVGQMVAQAVPGVVTVTPPGAPMQWPVEPTLLNIGGIPEHPMFVDVWRESTAASGQTDEFDLNRLVSNNWDRLFGVDYGTALTALVHQHSRKKGKKSFIGRLYGQVAGLEWDDGLPLLRRVKEDTNIVQFLKQQTKPIVVCHFGMDKQPGEYAQAINYRIHKVWSLHRWAELADRFKDQFTFVQVHHAPNTPDIPGYLRIQCEDLNPLLQLIEACAFFLTTDNYIPHLAASLPRKGIVLWGSCSPNVWGWRHNVNIWNQESCVDIGCWRPGMFDGQGTGKLFLCDHYSCMKSISVDQVSKAIDKLVGSGDTEPTSVDETAEKIKPGQRVKV